MEARPAVDDAALGHEALSVLEANWTGRLVVELYNAANLPVRLYAEEGFVQILFFESDEDCRTSYADRAGKYQGQTGLTLPRL